MNDYFVDLSDPSRGPGTSPPVPHGTEPAGTSPRVRRPVGTTPASLATVSLLLAGFWGTWLALTLRLLLDGSRRAGGPAILSAGLMVLAYLGLGAALLAARQERPGDRARYLRRASPLGAAPRGRPCRGAGRRCGSRARACRPRAGPGDRPSRAPRLRGVAQGRPGPLRPCRGDDTGRARTRVAAAGAAGGLTTPAGTRWTCRGAPAVPCPAVNCDGQGVGWDR